ncbi:MAG TPA: UDP-forming cellulose synthase catalytic subunit [Chthoniobacteraceae bacterium]|nr:UDP-forming cellulose synthase catalytic subunit [Chthoniobacteraceae bacterium]
MQGQTFKIPSRTSASSGASVSSRPPPASPRRPDGRSGTGGRFVIPFISFGVLAYLASGEESLLAQLTVAATLLLALAGLRMLGKTGFARVGFLALSTFVILRYFFWRTFYTVEFTDWVSFTCAIILYLAEAYGITIAIIGNFVNLFPYERPAVELPAEGPYPSVDIFIPSYDESLSLLEPTVIGAVQTTYPGPKRVYLLDDGGTDQKCQKGTAASMAAARTRRADLQALCQELGVTYLTRARNVAAKAGNINEAMKKSSGDLVVILDADHIPTTDFLEKTVGYFLEDPKLFLVQTPHFMVNPDPIEKNLDTFGKMPSENDMFYRVIQKGLDFWNSSFFCGSGAVLRRAHLNLVGGISSKSITEDAETALSLHAKGLNSAYVATPLLSGLAAESLSGFIGQRQRWAQGMIQIFLLNCPLFNRGLTLPQRICYFNSCLFWFFPFSRLVYILAPAAFLFFGLKIYAATVETFLSHAVPYLIVMLASTSYIYGRARWAFVSELYELLQSIHTIPAIIATVIRPRSPIFKVTPKQEQLSEDFVSPIATPFYFLALINFACLFVGIYSFFAGTYEQLYPLLITLFWGGFNTVILLAVLGALFERRQRRSTPRTDTGIPIAADLHVNGATIPCEILDLSLGGCKLAFLWGAEETLADTSSGDLLVTLPGDAAPTTFHLEFRNYREGAQSNFTIGAQFAHRSLAEKMAKVRLVCGNSERWSQIQANRESSKGVITAFAHLTGIGITGFIPHFLKMCSSFFGVADAPAAEPKPEKS